MLPNSGKHVDMDQVFNRGAKTFESQSSQPNASITKKNWYWNKCKLLFSWSNSLALTTNDPIALTLGKFRYAFNCEENTS